MGESRLRRSIIKLEGVWMFRWFRNIRTSGLKEVEVAAGRLSDETPELTKWLLEVKYLAFRYGQYCLRVLESVRGQRKQGTHGRMLGQLKYFYEREKEAKNPREKYRICNLSASLGYDARLVHLSAYTRYQNYLKYVIFSE